MGIEQWWNDIEQKCSEKNQCHCHFLKMNFPSIIFKSFSLYRAVNTLRIGYKNCNLMPQIITVFFLRLLQKPTKALCGQNVEKFIVKCGGK
jgi:hypothetical protein